VSEGPDQIPSPEDIEKHISELKSKKGSLRAERGLLVETVRGLRATTSESKGRSLSRKKYLSVFNENKEIANAKRKERDDINLAIPPPLSVLEEWASKSLTKLQGVDNDLTAMPTLSREIREFSRYFELIAAIEVKRKGELAHSSYVEHIGLMKQTMDDLEKEHPKEDLEGESGSKIKSNMKEIRKISKRIEKLDKEIESISSDIKKMVNRKKDLKSQNRIKDAKSRVLSGSNIAAGDIALLLDGGSILDDLAKMPSEPLNRSSSNIQNKQKSRRISPARGGPRKTRQRPDK
jgi:hypothetical protein